MIARMAHHEVEFPNKIGRGTAVGPGWDNAIVSLRTGAVEVSQTREQARRKYLIQLPIKRQEALAELIAFSLGRHGSANSWNLKDWSDYATTPTGTTHHSGDAAISHLDQSIDTGDGVRTQFQLVKRYTSGLQTVVRPIEKIRNGTVTVGINGGAFGAGGYSVNDTTGIITFTTPPAAGDIITAGFEFLVPVRFTAEVDEWLQQSLEGFDYSESAPLEAWEELHPSQANDDVPPLGAKQHGAITANVTISQQEGLLHTFSQSVASLEINLPAIAGLYTGLAFILANKGSTTLTVRDATATVVGTIPAGASIDLLVADSGGGGKTWIAA